MLREASIRDIRVIRGQLAANVALTKATIGR